MWVMDADWWMGFIVTISRKILFHVCLVFFIKSCLEAVHSCWLLHDTTWCLLAMQSVWDPPNVHYLQYATHSPSTTSDSQTTGVRTRDPPSTTRSTSKSFNDIILQKLSHACSPRASFSSTTLWLSAYMALQGFITSVTTRSCLRQVLI